MFLEKLNRDFNKEEEKILDQHYNQVGEYLEEYIIPEIIAFYIASGYYESLLYKDSLDIYINSVLAEYFNYEVKDLKKLRKNLIKLLKIKYNLKVIEICPLVFKS